VCCGAVGGDQKAYDYQFPTAVKARRAKIDPIKRTVRVYEASKQAAYVTSFIPLTPTVDIWVQL